MEEAEYHTMYETEDTHWWYVSLHTLILGVLPKGGRDTLRILDAGCGTGRLMQLLTDAGHVHGCDISALSVEYCRARGLSNVEQNDLNTLHLKPASYDIVTTIDVLYHQWVLDDRCVLKELYDGLKPGGTLIIQVPAYEWLRSNHDKAVSTGRRYTKSQVISMLLDCGFEIEKATYRVSLLFLLIAIIRLIQPFLKPGRKGRSRSDLRNHSRGLNGLLMAIMKAENLFLKLCPLPFGTSVFAVARKRDAASHSPIPEELM